ncbi:copper resistance CopC family protein [Actinosynnema sp. NPDC050801]|uniref:copper resistance CopC family protein n=1 Tax=unclassified Actinosynnema TaxID=2637065 RepID=UPI0033D5D986
MTRLALSALLATLTLFGVAPQALAHTDLVSSDPANGASVPQRPTRLTLTFTEPVPAESATVTVTGPDGSTWPLGEVVADGATLTIAVRESGSPAGPHTVAWMVESLDGDFVDGTFAFTLTAPPAAPAPTTTPAITAPAATSTNGAVVTSTSAEPAGTLTLEATTPTSTSSTSTATVKVDDDGPPLWVWILIAAVLCAIGIAIGVALRRRAARAETTEGTDGPSE